MYIKDAFPLSLSRKGLKCTTSTKRGVFLPGEADEIGCPSRGLFVLGLQQVVDSFIAGLLTDEAVERLARKRNRSDQVVREGTA